MNIDLGNGIPKVQSPVSLKAFRPQLFELGLLVVIIGLFYWFILQPKRAEVSVKEDQLAQLQKDQRLAEDNLEKVKTLAATLKNHPADIAKLDDGLPLEGKITSIHLLIDKLAQDSGVTLGDLSVSPKANIIAAGNTSLLKDPYGVKRSLQTIGGGIFVTGTFQQLQTFLAKLEQSGRIINITSININGSSNNQLDLKLSVEMYYYAPN